MSPPPSEQDSSDDFWDLDDDDLDLDPTPVVPAESPQKQAEQKPEASNGQKPADPAPERAAPVAIEKSEPEEHPKEAVSTPKESAPAVPKEKSSLFEKISIASVLAVLLGAAAWGIAIFYEHAPEGELVVFDTDFPIKGDNVTVAEVETWWRPPVREGEDADRGVRLNVKLIPCARIKLQDSGSAFLWVTFRDGGDQLIGDSINLSVEGGKFTQSGSEEITIHSTAGFSNPSSLNPYVNGDTDPWSVVIIEGNVNDDPSTDAEALLKVKVEPVRPDQSKED